MPLIKVIQIFKEINYSPDYDEEVSITSEDITEWEDVSDDDLAKLLQYKKELNDRNIIVVKQASAKETIKEFTEQMAKAHLNKLEQLNKEAERKKKQQELERKKQEAKKQKKIEKAKRILEESGIKITQ
jgi:hypothetical protein